MKSSLALCSTVAILTAIGVASAQPVVTPDPGWSNDPFFAGFVQDIPLPGSGGFPPLLFPPVATGDVVLLERDSAFTAAEVLT
jgi:hypothetical protein